MIFYLTDTSQGKSQAARYNDVSGVYVREYTIDVAHKETGDNLGMRKIRDTIFIEQADNNYLISNRKWRMNDYDQEGWVSMEHVEDRSMPSFFL